MKVIKDNSKKRITCPSCDSILEYDHKDVKNINGVKNIHCPVCDTDIQIPRKKKKKKQKDDNYYSKRDGDGDLVTLKNACIKCGNDLHKLLITNYKKYSCFNCGYTVDLGQVKKVDLGKGIKCKWL